MGNKVNKGAPFAKLNELEEGKAKKETEAKSSKLSSMKTGWTTIKLVMPYFWPKDELVLRLRIIACVFILIGGRVINIFVPLYYEKVIDGLSQVPMGTAVPVGAVLMYGLFRFISNNARDLRDSIFIQVQNHVTRSIALSTFTHLEYMSLGFHLTRNTGALLRTMDRGKSAIETMVSILFFTIVPTLLEVFLTCIVLLNNFGGWYALVTFLTITGYVVFTFVVTEWRTKYRRMMNEKENQSSNTALDALINFETVKYFAAERHEVGRYDNALRSYFDINVKTQYSLAFLDVGQMSIITIGLVVIMLIAARAVIHGTATVGELVAVNAYMIQLYTPLSWLGTSYRMIVSSFTDMEKLFELLNENPDVKDIPNASQLLVDEGTVEFKNVFFTYAQRSNSTQSEQQKRQQQANNNNNNNSSKKNSNNAPVLRGISFTVPGGKTVAIVGHSGSGKTTISRLLCRFYDCESGTITIDGQDISKVTQSSLRKAIGVVPQDTVLFNDTIQYNIAYGRVADLAEGESVSVGDVQQASIDAKLHDFIMSTPDQYNTIVGERGLRLSGGEKQRVAIARTILKDPRLLILDEATSALDSRTEKDIQSSLMEVSKGRTTVIIAHRLSTIVDADEILVLKGGEIVERGSHSHLLSLEGEYKAMWDLQAQQAQKESNKDLQDTGIISL